MKVIGWLFIIALLIMAYAAVVYLVFTLGTMIYDEIKERMDNHK